MKDYYDKAQKSGYRSECRECKNQRNAKYRERNAKPSPPTEQTVDFTNIVKCEDNKVFTTSLDVARVFGKNHSDVLKAIDNLGVPQDFNESNFALVEYFDAKGEKRPCYNLTELGTSILVMGFTGAKAMQFFFMCLANLANLFFLLYLFRSNIM